MAGFPIPTDISPRISHINRLLEVHLSRRKPWNPAIYAALILCSIVLLTTSITFIGPKTITFPEPKPDMVQSNPLRLRGMDFNKSAVSRGNFGIDYVLYGKPKTDFLRVSVGDIYKDGLWYHDDLNKTPYTGQILAPDTADYIEIQESEFRILAALRELTGFLPGPIYPKNMSFVKVQYNIRLQREYTYIGVSNSSYLEDQKMFYTDNVIGYWQEYSIFYYSIKHREQYLENASLHIDPLYLEMPEEIERRVKSKAEQITEEAETPFQKITALIDFLQTDYNNSLDYVICPSSKDPILWFLFSTHMGTSIHFNSALIMLARSIGVPARLVGGYPLNMNKRASTRLLYSNERAAFAEVYFDDIGWVYFDATLSKKNPLPLRILRQRSSKSGTVEIVEFERKLRNEIIILLFTGLVGFVVLVLIIYLGVNKWVSKNKQENELEEESSIPKDMVDSRLRIEFPEILPFLPNVWGVNAPLKIRIRAQANETTPLSGTTIIKCNDEVEDTFVDGTKVIQRTFTNKGRYSINISLELTDEIITSIINIRIVDYREEIIRLFNEVFKETGDDYKEIWDQLTAREFQKLIHEEYPDISQEELERIATLFEIADYSTHIITRLYYIRFYSAKLELERSIKDGNT